MSLAENLDAIQQRIQATPLINDSLRDVGFDNATAVLSTYIAGPMSPASFGLTEKPDDWDWNHPMFHRIADVYRQAGHNVINPAELDSDIGVGHAWDVYLRRDLKALADCDHIESRGASTYD